MRRSRSFKAAVALFRVSRIHALWMAARRTKPLFDVRLHQLMKLLGDIVTTQGHRFLAIYEDWGCRRLPRSGQADPDICVLAFPWAIDDAAHHGNLQRFHPGILLAPDGHMLTQKILDLLGQFLEASAGRAATTRTRSHTGHEQAQPQGLKDFRRDHTLLSP